MKAYKLHGGVKRRWRKIALLIAASLVVLGGVTLFAVRRVYLDNLKAVDVSAREEIVVAIASGSSLDQIATNLEQKKVIKADWAFKRYVNSKELGESLKAGTYRFNTSQDVASIVDDLVEGRVDVSLFTIFPGQRIDQIRDAFIETGGYTIEEVDTALSPAHYSGHPALVDKPTTATLEGYLYPDSYQRVAETRPDTIIAAALDEMAKALTPDVRAGIVAQGLNIYEGIILASVVEGEVSSANPEDKPRVAQVFLKRLKEDKALESNATTLYGAALEGKLKGLTRAEILDQYESYESAYNTYSHKGLPPSPVSNVSATSLQAVARPAQTNFLYFVSGDDCVTYFSNTFDEHQANIDKHLKKGCGN